MQSDVKPAGKVRVLCGQALIGSLIVLLTACATPYQPLTGLEGFDERESEDGTWEVGFQANARTSVDQARSMALRRVEDIGAAQAQRYYEILDETWTVDVQYSIVDRQGILTEMVIPVPGGTMGVGPMMGGDRRPMRLERPSVLLTVRFHRLYPGLPEGPVYSIDQSD